jgi:hypothetical protein
MTEARRMAVMASQTAQEPRSPGEGVSPPRKRMDMLTRALVLRLREGDAPLSYAEIAQRLDISESSARRICQFETADRKASIKRLMQSGDLERLDEWAKASRVSAKRGYYQAAEAWLQASGSIDAKPTASTNVNVAPTVVLSMPFQLGALQPPSSDTALEAQAVPVLPPKDAA